LSYSALTGATLRYSTLVSALFNGVDLRKADLRDTELAYATLNGVSLAGADLSNAHFSKTALVRCHDLHLATGLASIEHASLSAVDIDTLRHCGAWLPDEFLQGVGVEREEVERLRPASAASR
jgi:uncharacterized protein YjbI with pentapeptide repeats